MKIWIITWSDGFDSGQCFTEAYDDETTADLRALELNEKWIQRGVQYGGYSVEEYELNTRTEP